MIKTKILPRFSKTVDAKRLSGTTSSGNSTANVRRVSRKLKYLLSGLKGSLKNMFNNQSK